MRKAIFLFAVGFASTAALVSSQQRNAVAVERGGGIATTWGAGERRPNDPVQIDKEQDSETQDETDKFY
jgi:hypothetical protein